MRKPSIVKKNCEVMWSLPSGLAVCPVGSIDLAREEQQWIAEETFVPCERVGYCVVACARSTAKR